MAKEDNVVLSFMASRKFADAVTAKQIAGGYHNRSDALRNFTRKGAGIDEGDEIDGKED